MRLLSRSGATLFRFCRCRDAEGAAVDFAHAAAGKCDEEKILIALIRKAFSAKAWLAHNITLLRRRKAAAAIRRFSADCFLGGVGAPPRFLKPLSSPPPARQEPIGKMSVRYCCWPFLGAPTSFADDGHY